MSSNYQLKLTSEQCKALMSFTHSINKSRFKDPENLPTVREVAKAYVNRTVSETYFKPEAYDFLNPTTQIRDEWGYYLFNLGYQAVTERESSKKTTDTAKKRLKAVKKLKGILGHWPTAADLESVFSDLPKLDRSILELIDQDLEYLKLPLPTKPKAVRAAKSPATKKRRV